MRRAARDWKCARRPRSPHIARRESGSRTPRDSAGGVMRSSAPHRTSVGTPDLLRAVALLGEPHRLGADAVGGGVDAGHGLDHFAAHRGSAGWASNTSTRASAIARRSPLAAIDRAHRSPGRRDGRRRCRRGSATLHAPRPGVRASRSPPRHRATGRRHARPQCRARVIAASIGCGIIVARRAFGSRIAIAVARIIERDRAPLAARNARAAGATRICPSRRRGERRWALRRRSPASS